MQYFSISLAERDVAVNFEEQLELTVILGLPAHFIGPRCITKEFRDTVFKYLRFAVLQHSIVVSNIQHTVFVCMYVTYVCMYVGALTIGQQWFAEGFPALPLLLLLLQVADRHN